MALLSTPAKRLSLTYAPVGRLRPETRHITSKLNTTPCKFLLPTTTIAGQETTQFFWK